MNRSNYFILHSNCLPVKGVRRSVICDLQNGNYSLIPNDMYDILLHHNDKSIGEIFDFFGAENQDTITSYFNFLINNKFVFIVPNKRIINNFPRLNLEWDFPAIISNCIIDINAESPNVKNIQSISNQLHELNCKYLQVRIFDILNIDTIDQLLKAFDDSCIVSIEVVLPYSCLVFENDLERILNYRRVLKVVFFDAPFHKSERTDFSAAEIYYMTNIISSEKDCGKVNSAYFSCNVTLFTESLIYNSCLNRKIAIDKNGNIKNCPSMQWSYGDINCTTLKSAINADGFKDLWLINKDKVLVCNSCEFRYICTDCRAYLENPADIYSKPLKCGYNPNLCVWEDWVENPLKKQAMTHYFSS